MQDHADLIAAIKAAYEKIGYQPMRRKDCDENKKLCCPYIALIKADAFYLLQKKRFPTNEWIATNKWISGFIAGVDGRKLYAGDSVEGYEAGLAGDSVEGYEAGLAVAKVFFGEN